MKALALLACCALATGCLSGRYTRVREGREPGAAVLSALVPGDSDLTQCLDLLGAPHFVEERGNDVVASWGWFGSSGFGLSLSVAIRTGLSASLRYNQVSDRTRGLVLFFDEDLVLERVKQGFLTELRPELARRRPQTLE